MLSYNARVERALHVEEERLYRRRKEEYFKEIERQRFAVTKTADNNARFEKQSWKMKCETTFLVSEGW